MYDNNLRVEKGTGKSRKKSGKVILIIIFSIFLLLIGSGMYRIITMPASSMTTTDWDMPVKFRFDSERKCYEAHDKVEEEMDYILTVRRKGFFKPVIYQTTFLFKNHGKDLQFENVDFEDFNNEYAILKIHSDYMDEIVLEIPYK